MPKPGVYIIYSKKLDKYYIGSTNNAKERLHNHNNGKVISTIKGIPWKLQVFIPCENITDARKAEVRLKKYKRRDITEEVIKTHNFPWNYKKEKDSSPD